MSGSRERRRARSHQRKQRGSTDRSSRSEQRNEQARAELEPLEAGERPLAVTVGAALSALIVLSIAVGYATGVEVDGERPALLQTVAPALLMGTMAIGMWRARYWAVLGFQAVLLFLILGASIGLVQATGIAQIAANSGVLAGSGLLFYRMIKAMARIQMPSGLPRE